MRGGDVHRMKKLDLDVLSAGRVHRVHVELVADGLGEDLLIPILVAKGRREGPCFGITAAVHGNELNGIRVIHDLFEHIDVQALRGTVVGVLVVNLPGLHQHQREFVDGRDLNHRFPGVEDGNIAQVYVHRVIDRIVTQFDRLVDLHTASFGRVNSLYVRADMTHRVAAQMAYLQRPQIIVHNPASDHTLRGAAMELNIPAITIEIGDPQLFQARLVRSTRRGLRAVLTHARMLPKKAVVAGPVPVLCSHSKWMYTDRGGLLDVLPETAAPVVTGERIAILRNAFGDLRREYYAQEDGIVVGKSVNPVGQTGARILHLGTPAEEHHGFVKREG